jgi:F-type H+-transporting ATPase subunit delta
LIGSSIAKRYAKAFFEIAGEENKYEQYYNELRQFSNLLAQNEDLLEFLDNPVFSQVEKKAVTDTILQKLNLSLITNNFLKVLVDKQRIGILAEIDACYRDMMDEILKKARVTVKTAFPLSAELQDKLKGRLEQMTGKNIEIAVSEDPSLLGGVVVSVGDTLHDGSIRTQLNKIRNLLGEEI